MKPASAGSGVHVEAPTGCGCVSFPLEPGDKHTMMLHLVAGNAFVLALVSVFAGCFCMVCDMYSSYLMLSHLELVLELSLQVGGRPIAGDTWNMNARTHAGLNGN